MSPVGARWLNNVRRCRIPKFRARRRLQHTAFSPGHHNEPRRTGCCAVACQQRWKALASTIGGVQRQWKTIDAWLSSALMMAATMAAGKRKRGQSSLVPKQGRKGRRHVPGKASSPAAWTRVWMLAGKRRTHPYNFINSVKEQAVFQDKVLLQEPSSPPGAVWRTCGMA